MTVAQEVSRRYFSRKTLNSLGRLGVTVEDTQLSDPYAPVPDFILVQNGTVFCRSFLGVLDLAAGRGEGVE